MKSPLALNLRDKRISHDNFVLLMTLLAGLPAVVISLVLLWYGDYTAKYQWTLSVIILLSWFGFGFGLRDRVVRPLQTLSNLLAALQEGDFSLRARGAGQDDALGEVLLEVNTLGETLRQQRLGAMEATALAKAVMAEINVAIFTFNHEHELRFVNRAGEELLGQPTERLIGRTVAELGLAECFDERDLSVLDLSFPGGGGRWGIHRSMFREEGRPNSLLVLTDLSRELREEEKQAWQRLVRVLGHELNNSLTPIKSIAGSLETMLNGNASSNGLQNPELLDDMKRGLNVISSRADALSRFMAAYARLARLPQPRLAPLSVDTWIRRVVSLETRLPVKLVPGKDLVIQADGDQLDQLLINLVRNAVDAALETGGGVRVGWHRASSYLEVWVEDDGPGLANTSNLFVPFFTTKAGGSGIGLALSQQISEAHGGKLTLENRVQVKGCVATLRLPL